MSKAFLNGRYPDRTSDRMAEDCSIAAREKTEVVLVHESDGLSI